ncbi:hypothetical protein F2Q68_00015732 [Brassica cretica]|uniref:Uncharacterized protein n=2 Tax=Brassica cretica TaxID=69181 RepID=A0A8S9HIQ5_BRACR|nr:hypothetical protein F2Q68_00015732 [Brassica cretica]KAF3610489.1 hypothetical protein DY000_02048307 [Brassica cretica]
MGRDASCLERSCVWSRMCAEEAANVPDEERLRAFADQDLNLARKSCWFGLGFQKTKTAPRIVPAGEGASEIGSMNGLR